MSSWRKESKEVTRSRYGGYCNMCRELKINFVPYHKFDQNEYFKVLNQFKKHKTWNKETLIK